MKINNILLWSLGIILSATIMTGCTETPEELNTPALHLDVKAVTATGIPGELITFDITSDRDWEIMLLNGEEEWITLDQMKGTGKATVSATLKRNLGAQRIGKIEILTDKSARGTFTITQKSMPVSILLSNSFEITTTVLAVETSFDDFIKLGNSNNGIGSYLIKLGVTDKSQADITKIFINGDPASASNTYSEASARNYMCLKTSDQNFSISDIRIEDATNLIVTFGCNQYLATEFDYSDLYVTYRVNEEQPWKKLEYSRKESTGWDKAIADIQLPSIFVSTSSTPRHIDLNFSSMSGNCRIDDIKVMAKEGTIVKFEPMPKTHDIPFGNIFFNSAIIPASYIYPPLPPAIVERGIAWKVSSATELNHTSLDFPNGIAEAGDFEVTVAPLTEDTDYTYQTYVKDAIGNKFYGEVQTFKTPKFERIQALSTFSDGFGTIPANNRVYREKGWDAWHPDSDNVMQGWKTRIKSDMAGQEYPAHLSVAPSASSANNINAYAIMPAIDISAATDKSLYFNYSMKPNGLIANNGTKLEVVISTDYRGVYSEATWTVLDDATLDFNAPKSQFWNFKKIDLSAYATTDWAIIAFRYKGKGIDYHISSVKYGDIQKVEYGTPAVVGNMSVGTQNSDVKILLPYRYGLGTAANITITSNDSNLSFTNDTPNHELGNGSMNKSLVFSVVGTPSEEGKIVFKIAYNDTNTIGKIESVTGAVYSADGLFTMANQSFMPVNGALPDAIDFVSNKARFVNFTSGLRIERVSANPCLIMYQISGALQSGPSWATSNRLNPTEYYLISVPVISETLGEVDFETNFLVANNSWLGKNFNAIVTYSSSADPIWHEAVAGGSVLLDKFGIVPPIGPNTMPLKGKFSISSDNKIMPGGFLYFKIFVNNNGAIGNNAAIHNCIKVTNKL